LTLRLKRTGRAQRSKSGNPDGSEIDLPCKSPYDWQAIMRFYQSHLIRGLERVTANSFERVFDIEGRTGIVRIEKMVGVPQLKVHIAPDQPEIRADVIERVRKMFDLDCDPMVIERSFRRIPLLAALCKRSPGLRLARGWDPFETAICSILGQLVSAPQRANLIGQLVDNYGAAIAHPSSGENMRLFPDAAVLANADLSAVRTTIARREAIRDFSRRVLSGAISLGETQDRAAFRKALLDTKGLGPWSAEYISLRAIGDTDAFPKTDLILKRALLLHPELDLALIKPWRAYAATYLWQEFARSLSKSKKENNLDASLQRVRIPRRQAQIGRKLQRFGGGALGTRAAKPSKA
jgi:AraC family transcriptional regulator of adaptative response / DNA-3-methyladenine glycosylase II